MDSNRKQSQQGETKQNKRAKTMSTTPDTSFEAAQHPSFFVQSELIPKEYKNQNICSNFLGDLKDQWVLIYAFLDLSYAERIEMRCLCRLFHKVEKLLTLNKHGFKLMPIPIWTSFPHPNYPTLNGLMNELNDMYAALPSEWEECTVPGTLVLGLSVRVKYVDDEFSDDDDETDDEFEDATIEKVNDDETFDIVYDYIMEHDDDNDYYGARKNVPVNEIQIQNVRYFIMCFPFRVLYIVCFAHNSSFLYLLSFTYI